MSFRIEIETEAQLNRLIHLTQEDIYSLTGQLVVATRRTMDRNVGGGQRTRANKAITAIPEQIEKAEATRSSLVDALREGRLHGSDQV